MLKPSFIVSMSTGYSFWYCDTHHFLAPIKYIIKQYDRNRQKKIRNNYNEKTENDTFKLLQKMSLNMGIIQFCTS